MQTLLLKIANLRTFKQFDTRFQFPAITDPIIKFPKEGNDSITTGRKLEFTTITKRIENNVDLLNRWQAIINKNCIQHPKIKNIDFTVSSLYWTLHTKENLDYISIKAQPKPNLTLEPLSQGASDQNSWIATPSDEKTNKVLVLALPDSKGNYPKNLMRYTFENIGNVYINEFNLVLFEVLIGQNWTLKVSKKIDQKQKSLGITLTKTAQDLFQEICQKEYRVICKKSKQLHVEQLK